MSRRSPFFEPFNEQLRRQLGLPTHRSRSVLASFGEPQGDGDPGYEVLMEPRLAEPVPYSKPPVTGVFTMSMFKEMVERVWESDRDPVIVIEQPYGISDPAKSATYLKRMFYRG